MSKKLKILAAKIFHAAILTGVLFGNTANAGIPVIDGTNLSENVISAMEEVAQTIKQIEQYATQVQQYQTQLQQYENMLQNTMQPAANIWQAANSTMNKLNGMTNTISGLENKYGNLQTYISKFQSAGSYQQNPCFNGGGCNQAQISSVLNSQAAGSQAQIAASAASLESLQQQQANLEADAANLEQIQGAAQGATGQMQALGYANQLAAAESNQLMQIRSLLIAQQNVLTTRAQAQADLEAQQAAAGAQFRRSGFVPSPVGNW